MEKKLLLVLNNDDDDDDDDYDDHDNYYYFYYFLLDFTSSFLHCTSFPQFTYDSYHISLTNMNPQLTSSQRQWLHSPVGRASHR